MSSHVGKLVNLSIGNYRLVQFLGGGKNAEVYVGEHIYLETLVAVKVLYAQFNEADQQHFLEQARYIAASLDHPSITRLIDFGMDEQSGKPFLVFNYAPGGNLRTRYPQGVRVSLVDVVYYARQVAGALHFAHSKSIVHGDVKPENVLAGLRNEIWLSDAGMMAIMRVGSEGGFAHDFGTPAYMAPEQIQGQPGPASDQYALGIVVYEWLCGERPFYGNPVNLSKKHLFDPPPPLRNWLPSLSPDIEEVVHIALAKSSDARFASVEAFAHALEQASGLAPWQLSGVLTTPESDEPVPVPVAMPYALLNSGIVQKQGQQKALVDDQEKMVDEVKGDDVQMEKAERVEQVAAWAQAGGAPGRRSKPVGRVSRRALVLGLGSVLVLGGVGVLAATHYHPLPAKTNATTPVPARSTPTSIPAKLLLNTTQFVYRGHGDGVFAVSWSPDGMRIASGGGTNEARPSLDNSVQVWNVATGELLVAYKGHSHSVLAVAWSPDGTYVASGGAGRSLHVWDAHTAVRLMSYERHIRPIQVIAWSPDSKRLASGGDDNTVLLCDVTATPTIPTQINELIYERHTGFVNGVAWSPDGTRVISASDDGTAQVWQASDGKTLLTYRGHAENVRAVAWSPDGTRVVSAGGRVRDYSVQMWDPATGARKLSYTGHAASVTALAWSPDGRMIASASYDKMVHIWRASDGTLVGVYQRHTDQVWDVAWSLVGNLIASSGRDRTVQIWRP